MVEAAAWVACMSDTAVPVVRLFQKMPEGLSMVPGLQESVADKAVGSWQALPSAAAWPAVAVGV